MYIEIAVGKKHDRHTARIHHTAHLSASHPNSPTETHNKDTSQPFKLMFWTEVSITISHIHFKTKMPSKRC